MVKIFQFRTFSKTSVADEKLSFPIIWVLAKLEKSDVLKSRIIKDLSSSYLYIVWPVSRPRILIFSYAKAWGNK